MNTSPTRDCSVCIEPIKGTRKGVVCQYCGFESCRMCYQKYCVSQRNTACMNCKKTHSLTFFSGNVNASFYKGEWNDIQRKKLFEREQARFPETQLFIQEHKYIIERMAYLTEQINTLQYEKNNLFNRERHIIYNGNYKPKEKIPECIVPCPMDGCKGLVMTNHKCGICETKVCKDCNEVLDGEDHKCDPNKVESVKFIRATTKPCPKCGARIHRYEGCDQCFCTLCHTAFSYRTGQIEKGRIHNPHYFEYLRSISPDGNIRREQGDVPQRNGCCINDDLDLIQAHALMGKTYYYPVEVKKEIDEIYRKMIHLERVVKSKYDWHIRQTRDEEIVKNRDLRVKYMEGKLSREKYENSLRLKQKKIEKCEEIYPVVDMIIRVINDLLTSLPPKYDPEDIVKIRLNINKLVFIANQSLEQIEKTLKLKSFRFAPNLDILADEKKKKEE